MPTKRSASKSAKSGKKKATKAKTSASRKRAKPAKSSGPLVDVARKIGTTLGDLAVRAGLAGPDDEPGPTQQ